jgi:protein TonB
MLLSAARDRKPAERPLTLAIVSDDASAPKALQAGANSILRKPLIVNQVTDTLTTARDLLRSRRESANAVHSVAAAAAASAPAVPRTEPVSDKAQHAGNALQSMSPAPGGQFETDTDVSHFPEQSAAEQTDPLKDLEPVATAVPEHQPAEPPPGEPKGLEWYLKARGIARQPGSVFATSPASPPAPPRETKPELLGYDQSPSSATPSQLEQSAGPSQAESSVPAENSGTQIFSSFRDESSEPSEEAPSRFRLGKGAIAAAIVLAALAVAAAPQAPWHSQVAGLWTRGRHSLHGWLNPQPVTSVSQAPTAHENFARPGDEYKLPVAENIPDATTDPSQISVVPVVDPTAKKTVPDPAATDPVTVAPEISPTTTPDAGQPGSTPSGTAQPAPAQPIQPAPAGRPEPTNTVPAATESPSATPISTPTQPAPTPPSTATTPRRQPAPYVPVTTKVPSSLQSQMATMTPEASGNKPAEAALPAIEPVAVPELTERALLSEQPPLAYPASAAGKQGTVTLQVLIGRDGTVQDAKFVQGSLAFARAAIDGVRQWKFKPYTMNGRPVSVQTSLTLRFAPGQ